MKATVERTPESEAVLTVSLEWAELDKAAEKAYKRLVQKYTVPGFRKGHAPRSMLERMLGKETIMQEGLEALIETSYRDALKENEITPVAQPTLDTPPIEQGQPYTYTARVPILIAPILGDYHSIRVPLPSTEVSDEEVEHELEHMREHAAMWLPTERAAQVDDKVTVNLTLTMDDKEISDLKDHEFELAIERPGIFAGLDDHLVGMKEGESAQFETTIPEDYANTALAGKTGHYDVTLTAVKYRELPELDDEFAKSMGDYETLADLRTKLHEQMQSRKEGEARRELRDAVANAAVEQAQVTMHPALVEDEVDSMTREMNRMLAQNRLNMEMYLQMVGKTEEEYRKELEPEAQGRVKRDLVLSAVADAEGIQVGDAEVEGFLQLFNILNSQSTRPQDLTPGQRASISSRLRRDNALDRLIDIATEGKGNQIGRRPEESEEAETPQAGESKQPSDQAQAQGAAEAARVGAELAGEQPAASTATNATAGTSATETSASNAATSTTSAPASPTATSETETSRGSAQSPATSASPAAPTVPRTSSSATTEPPSSAASATNVTTAQSAETQALSGAAGTEVPKPVE